MTENDLCRSFVSHGIYTALHTTPSLLRVQLNNPVGRSYSSVVSFTRHNAPDMPKRQILMFLNFGFAHHIHGFTPCAFCVHLRRQSKTRLRHDGFLPPSKCTTLHLKKTKQSVHIFPIEVKNEICSL